MLYAIIFQNEVRYHIPGMSHTVIDGTERAENPEALSLPQALVIRAISCRLFHQISRSNLHGVYGSPLAFLTSVTKMQSQ